MRVFFIPKAAFAAVVLLAASAAEASLITYTSQSAYLSVAGSTSIDSYDDLGHAVIAGPLDRTVVKNTYTVSTGPKNSSLYGVGEWHTPDDIWLSTGVRTDLLSFSNFSINTKGVGGLFFATARSGLYAATPTMTLTARDSTGDVVTFTLNAPDIHSFVGFFSTTGYITDVTVKVDAPQRWATVNDLHLSGGPPQLDNPVPEPATYGMLLGGLGMLGWMRRRRRA